MKKVAIVYDRVNKWGGAERVLLALHKIFPNASLYTSFYDSKKAKWAKCFSKVYVCQLNKIKFLRDKHEYLSLIMPFIFEQFDFKEYDLVISVTSEYAKSIITSPKTKHVCLCLTPTRYLWSHYKIYLKDLILQGWPIIAYLKWMDKIIANRPDKIIAISKTVQKRINKYYGRNSTVIFPPVCIPDARYMIHDTNSPKGYYLVVSRLVKYKKVDMVIEAFNKLNKKLIIVGTGKEEKKLKRMANKNIKFLDFVNENKLVELYSNAKCLICPQEEDFGLVSVEAQYFGTPVIAYGVGGLSETVVNGVTGVLFYKQTVKSLFDAIQKFDRMIFSSKKIKINAKKFSYSRFKDELLKNI